MRTWQVYTQTIIALLAVSMIPIAGIAQEVDEEPAQPEKPAWMNNLELSFVTTSGNTSNDTFASKFESKYAKDKNRLYMNARLIVQNSSGMETANQLRANGRYERTIGDKLFALLESEYVRDKFSGYEYRWSAGPGLGFDVLDSDRYSFKIYGAAVYYYDKFETDDAGVDDYLSAQATVDLGAKLQDNFEVSNDFDFSISTQDEENYFINNEVSARIRINSGFAVGLSYVVRYENQPPAIELKKLSTTFLTSLVLSF